jgi:hypothetical protein
MQLLLLLLLPLPLFPPQYPPHPSYVAK